MEDGLLIQVAEVLIAGVALGLVAGLVLSPFGLLFKALTLEERLVNSMLVGACVLVSFIGISFGIVIAKTIISIFSLLGLVSLVLGVALFFGAAWLIQKRAEG